MNSSMRSVYESIRNVYYIFLGQLYSLRVQWFWYFVMMSISPLSYLFFLHFYSSPSPNHETIVYSISGAITSCAVSAAMLSLGQIIGSMRESNMMEYYATLPISKGAFISAIALRGIVFSLPSAVIIYVTGAISLDHIMWDNLILLFVAFCIGSFSMAGLGAIVGFYGRTPQEVSWTTQVIQPLIVLFAPIYLPIDKLPPVLQVTSKFIPTTYISRAIRYTFGYGELWRYITDCAILLMLGAIFLIIAVTKVSWRLTDNDTK